MELFSKATNLNQHYQTLNNENQELNYSNKPRSGEMIHNRMQGVSRSLRL